MTHQKIWRRFVAGLAVVAVAIMAKAAGVTNLVS